MFAVIAPRSAALLAFARQRGTATFLGFGKGELYVGCVLYVPKPFELA